MARKKKRRSDPNKKLKCVECKQSSVGNERVGWVYIGSLGEVRMVSKTGKFFVSLVENSWVCCYDCLMSLMERIVTEDDEAGKNVKKQLKLTGEM